MGRKAKKKPVHAGAIGGKSQAPQSTAVPMRPSDSGIFKLSPRTIPTPVSLSDPTRFSAFANPSLKQNPGPWFNTVPSLYNYGVDENECDNFSEEQLEEIVINYIDCIYREVISRLVSFGYDAALALRAVLCKGHLFGAVDPLSNIMQNALAYLNTVAANTADELNAPAGAFSDLRHLQEYSLAAMLCLLQQIRGDLSRSEAMWCLLMSGLRVRRASSIKFTCLSLPGNIQAASATGAFTPDAAIPFTMSGDSEPASVASTIEAFTPGAAFSFTVSGDSELAYEASTAKAFTPSDASPFTVSGDSKPAYVASTAGVFTSSATFPFTVGGDSEPPFVASTAGAFTPSAAFPFTVSADSELAFVASTVGAFTSSAAFSFTVSGDPEPVSAYGAAAHPLESMKCFDSPPSLNFFPKENITIECFSELKMHGRQREQDVKEEAEDLVQLVLKRLEAMRIEDVNRKDKVLQDKKTEMIMDLIHHTRKLEYQAKATKQWAQQNVIKDFQKLGSNTYELLVLRVEQEENQRDLNEMKVLEDSNIKRRGEIKSILNKASKYVDCVSAFFKKLESGNSDIRANIEASKVSESFSLTACSKRIKSQTKYVKKQVPCEKKKKKKK